MRMFGSFAAITALAFATGFAQAGPLRSQYSDISNASCTTGANARGAGGSVVARCGTPFGITVISSFDGSATKLAFQAGSRKPGPALGSGYGHGDKIEWRGDEDGGRFYPKAAIVSLVLSAQNPSQSHVLAVVRVEKDRVCPAAWIDGNTRGSEEMARATADEVAASFSCAKGEPKIVGPMTAAVQDAQDRTVRR